MAIRNKPQFQQVTASLNDRITVPDAGGGIQAISPVLQVVIGANDVVREIRWSRFIHTMVGTQDVVFTFPVVPQGEAHKYSFIGIHSVSGTETWSVTVVYPSGGILPSDSEQLIAVNTFSDEGNLLAHKLNTDDTYGNDNNPFVVYPNGHLIVRSETPVAITAVVTLDLRWEIIAAPITSEPQVVVPVVTEVP